MAFAAPLIMQVEIKDRLEGIKAFSQNGRLIFLALRGWLRGE